MGQEKNAENIPFLRSTQPKSTERVPVVELSGFETRFATPTILLAIPETTDWEFRDSLLFSEPRIVAPNPWKLCFYR